MKRVLVVDDEPRIRELIREHLEAGKYQVQEAEDGQQALDQFRADPEGYCAVILDVMMPGLDGWSVCRQIRNISQLPVILLTARGEEYDKLFGFELGVDDYVVKPFSPKELMARLRAVLRRPRSEENRAEDWIRIGGLEIDQASRLVWVDGIQVHLTPREYELLVFLAARPGRAYSREQLLDQVWGMDYYGDARTVDTHIKMLREHLRPYQALLGTVRGFGYRFETGGPS